MELQELTFQVAVTEWEFWSMWIPWAPPVVGNMPWRVAHLGRGGKQGVLTLILPQSGLQPFWPSVDKNKKTKQNQNISTPEYLPWCFFHFSNPTKQPHLARGPQRQSLTPTSQQARAEREWAPRKSQDWRPSPLEADRPACFSMTAQAWLPLSIPTLQPAVSTVQRQVFPYFLIWVEIRQVRCFHCTPLGHWMDW